MPTSNLHIAPDVILAVEQVPHTSILDVGPGWGKYAVLLREYLNVKPERVDAVEAWAPYVEEHGLTRLYDTIRLEDIRDTPCRVLDGYDVVLMVDVIEHLPKPEALALVEKIRGRIVICTPVAYFDNGPNLPPTEEHVSHWTVDDWHGFRRSRDLEVCYQRIGGWIVRLGERRRR